MLANDLHGFLVPADANRAAQTLRHLLPDSPLVLTGGLAIEMQIARRGGRFLIRPLHDIDFLVASFDDVRTMPAEALFLRHVHPYDPPGKMLLQGVHRETSVRVDVFRAYGREMERTEAAEIGGVKLRLLRLEDLVARHARLCWDWVEGKTMAPKYARDFLRMLDVAAVELQAGLEAVWQEHRKRGFPATFVETAHEVRRAIVNRRASLVDPVYSTDVNEVCARCQAAAAFPLAPPQEMLARLGYC